MIRGRDAAGYKALLRWLGQRGRAPVSKADYEPSVALGSSGMRLRTSQSVEGADSSALSAISSFHSPTCFVPWHTPFGFVVGKVYN